MNKINLIKYAVMIALFIVIVLFYFRAVFEEIDSVNIDYVYKNNINYNIHPYISKIVDKDKIDVKLKYNNVIVDKNYKIAVVKGEKIVYVNFEKVKNHLLNVLIFYFVVILIVVFYDYKFYQGFKKMKLYKIYEKEHYITDKILYFLTFSLSHKLNSPLKIIERNVLYKCENNKDKIMNAVSEIKETILSMNSYYEWYHKLYSLFHIFYISKTIISIFEEEVDVRIVLDSELKKYKFVSQMMTDKMFLFLIILMFNVFIKILSTKIQVFVGKFDEKNNKLEIFIFNDGNNINDINLIDDNEMNEFKDIVSILKFSQIGVKVYYNNEKGFNVIVLNVDAEKIIGEIWWIEIV